MSRVEVRPAAGGLVRALIISLAAALIPAAGVFLFPDRMQDYEALLWLLLLVPAFLWAYERGWRGVATALALGMAALSITYAFAEVGGAQVPDLLFIVVALYMAISLGIGLFGDRLSRANFDAASETLGLQDPLTGLPNRRHAQLHLDIEFAAAERGRPLAVVVFDLDQMKAYNDRNGRSAGDGVLKGFATMLRQHTRRMDMAARLEGDEFISVLTGCNEEGAVVFAGRLQERLRAAEHTVSLPTVSAGIACYQPHQQSGAELLAAAAAAVQQAKADGRDRVRIFGRALDEMRMPTSAALQRGDAETAHAAAAASAGAVRFDAGAEPVGGIGQGRSAFLLTSDSSAHTAIGRFLDAEGFHTVHGTALADTIVPLQHEFDLVVVDIAPEAAAVADLIRQIRVRTPMTRVIGIPRTTAHGVTPEVLNIRVDAHYVASSGVAALREQVRELLRERDALQHAQLQSHQLSGELRARDREARLALAASEARYRSVVEAVQEVIFTADTAGVWTLLNPAWTAITGHTPQESIGLPLFDFIHPEDAAEARADYARMMSGAMPYHRHEGRWITRSGAVRWLEMRLQVVHSPAGSIEGASGLLADVTDRRTAEDALRRSEQYFRSLIENSADMMAVLNGDATIRYVSPAVERALGTASEMWIGTNALERVHPDDLDLAQARLDLVLAEPGAMQTVELRLRHADGSWRILEMSARNLLETAGVEGVVVNARDVTERRLTERALRESEELLLRTQKMDAIGRLAGGVAHDFNNLLTAIQGHADLLLADLPTDASVRSDLQEIRDAAGRATALTRQLLAFSRKQVMQPRPLDLNAIVHDMDRMLRRLIGDVELVTELAPDAGTVRADPVQLEQVLLNLIVNARDAVGGGGVITISTRRRRVQKEDALPGELPEGEYVELSVHDTGIGMSAYAASHAFEPFFTTKPPGEGTGLGLSTVYGIVKQSGGHVWLNSAEGAGTELTVLLPRDGGDGGGEDGGDGANRGDGGDGGDEKGGDIDGGGDGGAGSEGLTVLLVEDEKAVRYLTLRILERQGYRVLVAASGPEALKLFEARTAPVHLLLTDVVMPQMNGQELATRVRQMQPDIPIVFMSGYTEDAVLRDGVLAAGTTFLEKPFSPDGLVARVRETLRPPG